MEVSLRALTLKTNQNPHHLTQLAIELAKNGLNYPCYVSQERFINDTLLQDFHCIVCLEIPRLPHVICKPQCLSWTLCLPCLRRIVNMSVKPLCPVTRTPFSWPDDCTLDRRILKLLDEKLVRCEYFKSHGCEWIGKLSDWEGHMWQSLTSLPLGINCCPALIQANRYDTMIERLDRFESPTIPSYFSQQEPLRLLVLRVLLTTPIVSLPKTLTIELVSHYLDLPRGDDFGYSLKERVLDWLGF